MTNIGWVVAIVVILLAGVAGFFLYPVFHPPPVITPIVTSITPAPIRIPYPVTHESTVTVIKWKHKTDTLWQPPVKATLYKTDSTVTSDQMVLVHRKDDDTAWTMPRKTTYHVGFLGDPINLYQYVNIDQDPIEIKGEVEEKITTKWRDPFLQLSTDLSKIGPYAGGGVGLKISDFQGSVSWHSTLGVGYQATKYWTIIP